MWSIWIPKIAAFLAAVVVTYAASRGLTLSEAQLTAIFVAVLGAVKTLIGSRLNPGNVNAKELVEEPKAVARAARSTARARKQGGF
jgi:hypothetical protein